jgi:hypothetical protein
LTGPITPGGFIEAMLNHNLPDQEVISAQITRVDDSDTTYSRGRGRQMATGSRVVYAIEAPLAGDFAVTIDDDNNANAIHLSHRHSFEFRLIPEPPFIAGSTVRENQRATRVQTEFSDAARDAVLRLALERQLIPTKQQFDLTNEETLALLNLLTETIERDRYPLSPRIRMLRGILAKFAPMGPAPPTASQVTNARGARPEAPAAPRSAAKMTTLVASII